MSRSLRQYVIVAAAALLVLGIASTTSYAQARVLPNSQSIINPYYRVAPGLPLNQAAYNVRVMGRAYWNVPPWLYGYNPYPAPIITPYVTPVYPYYPPVYPYSYSPYPYPTYGSSMYTPFGY